MRHTGRMSADEPREEPAEEQHDRRRTRTRRRANREEGRRRVVGRRDPRMPYPVAAAAVGLLVAIMARSLVFAGEETCDAVWGTTSCGTAGGLMLLVIGALMLFLGTRLLRLLAVPEPGVTSALGMSLLAIAVLTVLLDQIFSPLMWIVLPLVAAGLYALAAWGAWRLSDVGQS